MRTRVVVAPQVEVFVKSLAPEPRRALTRAITSLAHQPGGVKSLEGELAGYRRLRVAGYREILTERARASERIVDCLFAERRAVIYELFAEQVRRQMEADDKDH